MALSGHKDPKSLKRYANLRSEHLADELARLSKTGGKNRQNPRRA
jgi:hypothetical protein